MSGSERVVFVEGNMGNPENNLLPYMDFSLNSTKEIWLRSKTVYTKTSQLCSQLPIALSSSNMKTIKS